MQEKCQKNYAKIRKSQEQLRKQLGKLTKSLETPRTTKKMQEQVKNNYVKYEKARKN